MTDTSRTGTLISEFTRDGDLYAKLSTTVADLLSGMLADEKLVVHSVTSRSKAVESLTKKLSRADKSYTALHEITDLAAVRITTYFARDVDCVAKIVEREFEVDRPNSIDKRVSLDPDRFGYQSLHYVVTLNSSRSELSEYRKYSGKKVEVQIRSILQHAWAEIEHDLGYKSASGVPREIRRRFARVAGLLEIADDEFSALREALQRYESEVPAKIAADPAHVNLDLPSLRATYATSSALAALDEAIANVADSVLQEGAPSTLERALNRLLYVGIRTVSDLDSSASKYVHLATEFAKSWMEEKRYEHLPMGIGTLYLAYVLMAEKQDKQEFIRYLNQFNIGDAEGREASATRALSIFSKIKNGVGIGGAT